ncbi:hypothetical protein IEN85_09180 [Pelagicoccus sp. NFK12]|uniref:Uncharacterized protein n=1 Tax=Pelagicoccus enzymogenes TaxID=2773457 RepID=A0A927F8H2_9BACT|nr:hypothetical protein [Pelagicoccus enzymogenes]MBD5779666.1 hypothetical protein [Pelagicoccus enzymogenes]
MLAALKSHCQGQLGDEAVESLDTGVPCLGLTFAEAGYNGQGTETLNATYSLTFDPKRDFDRWMEITIPLADFIFGYERNYVMKPASREALPPSEWIAFRINPETTSGKVARNYIGDAWDDSVPEIYKELSISLESIRANMKAGGSH